MNFLFLTKGLYWDSCETLFEDLWCCSIAKERISIPESTLPSDTKVSENAVKSRLQRSSVFFMSDVDRTYEREGTKLPAP